MGTEGILRDMVKGTCSLTPLGGAGTDLGGYKGYGWATVVELLCIAFQSGPYGEAICGIDRATGKKKSMPLGHFSLLYTYHRYVTLMYSKRIRVNCYKHCGIARSHQRVPVGFGLLVNQNMMLELKGWHRVG